MRTTHGFAVSYTVRKPYATSYLTESAFDIWNKSRSLDPMSLQLSNLDHSMKGNMYTT